MVEVESISLRFNLLNSHFDAMNDRVPPSTTRGKRFIFYHWIKEMKLTTKKITKLQTEKKNISKDNFLRSKVSRTCTVFIHNNNYNNDLACQMSIFVLLGCYDRFIVVLSNLLGNR